MNDRKAYLEIFNIDPSISARLAYESVLLLKEAMDQSPDSDVQAALEHTSGFQGLSE